MENLPVEVLNLICEELSNQQDFNGLFSCAVTSKTLVAPALPWLYRIHNLSPIITSEGNEADFLKWALLWKSIIQSSLGTTAYPYCLYIRSLDLQNLAYLLDDPKFSGTILNNFFADDMAKFLKPHGTPMKQKVRSAKGHYKRLDVTLTLELVGESITTFVKDSADRNTKAVTVEDISGQINATVLPIWISRLSRLKSMNLWDGSALNQAAAVAISEHCPNFNDLTFFTCLTLNVDQKLASFFTGLRPNTLRSFSALSADAVGPETLLALNNHSRSLKHLKLDGLRSEAIKKLSYLHGCDLLESLEIVDKDGWVSLEEFEHDIYLEVIAWLGSCEHLRALHFKNLVSGPSILTQVCLKNNVRLQKLQVVNYPMAGNQDFHKALSQQTSLEFLKLRADPEQAFRDDIDTLVDSISSLKKLKYLDILSSSDYFQNSEILTLSSHLPDLEELSFGGYNITDDLWHGLASLHHLRTLNIHAITHFSFEGILAFISTLQDTNSGLLLSIMSQGAEHALEGNEEDLIRRTLTAKVDGKFDFTLFRDPDSESESLSD